MIFTSPPAGFESKFEVVSCFLEKEGKFLLLNRQDHKPQGGTWGAPAGKVSPDESPVTAMARELWEETGIQINESDFQAQEKLFVRYDDYDFVYYIFSAPMNSREVTINPEEHTQYQWVAPEEALAMNLIQDMDACVKLFYKV